MDAAAPDYRRQLPRGSAEPPRRLRAATAVLAAERRPHLVVVVAGHPLAVPLVAVERIARLESLTPVPGAPAALRGVMVLSGGVVAVLDPTALFERVAMAPGAESCVLVIRRDTGGGELAAGLLVDGVRHVLELAPFEIAPPPRAGGLFAARWIAGMTRTDGLVPILDLASLLGSPVARAAVTAAGKEIERLWRETVGGRRRDGQST